MRIKETVEYFRDMVEGCGAYELCPCGKDDMEMTIIALSALEKQIPKKIKRRVITSGIILYHCPVCNEHYYQINLNFCQHCGQALDWSDTE